MSNINVTPGSGKTVATESLGGIEYQQIKLIDGKVGSSSVLSFVNNGTAIPVSVMGTITANFGGNASISGTVGASVIGTVPVTQSGAWVASVSGTVGASIIGSVPVTLTGNPSISGTVGASIIGTVPVTFVNSSISGQVNVGSVFGAMTPYAQSNSFVSGVTSVITGTTSVLTLAAPSAALFNYITHIAATNGAATGTFVNIVDGGQVIYAGYAAASGGGFSYTLPVPLKQPTSGIGLYAATTAQASVVVAVTGYKA